MSRTSRRLEFPIRPPQLNETLSGWLHRELRTAIVEGKLKPGVRLPPSRTLAADCKVSRGIVIQVFEQLISEGYLESKAGSGTSVRRELPDRFFHAAQSAERSSKPIAPGRLSRRGEVMSRSPFLGLPQERGFRAFRPNRPSVTHFPYDIWGRLSARRIRRASHETLLEGDVLGYRPLREMIAAHLGATRGVACDADQILIVSGTQQALDLVARVTLDPGDEVWMEDPGYPGAVAVFRAAGAKVVPVPVDENGLRVGEAMKRAPQARLAYVTPANQFPLCVALPLERRLKLLEWSRTTGGWIFEDDYDSEFRFDGRPLAAMQGLAPEGNVFFSGSFSKMLFPALRLGYLVAPKHLVEPLRSARSLLDRYGPIIEQAALGDFIEEGHFGRHLRRMREIYAEHLEVLTKETHTEWGDRLVIRPTLTGLQTVGRLAGRTDDTSFAQAALDRGVEMVPLSRLAVNWKRRDMVLLGFASVGPAELKRAVKVVAEMLG